MATICPCLMENEIFFSTSRSSRYPKERSQNSMDDVSPGNTVLPPRTKNFPCSAKMVSTSLSGPDATASVPRNPESVPNLLEALSTM